MAGLGCGRGPPTAMADDAGVGVTPLRPTHLAPCYSFQTQSRPSLLPHLARCLLVSKVGIGGGETDGLQASPHGGKEKGFDQYPAANQTGIC